MTEWKEHRQSSTEREHVDRAWHQRPVNFDVAEREILQVSAALERNVGRLANGAMSAIASSEVPDTNRFLSFVRVAQRADQTVWVLLKRDELDASLDRDTA